MKRLLLTFLILSLCLIGAESSFAETFGYGRINEKTTLEYVIKTCVPEAEAIKAWEDAVSRMDKPTFGIDIVNAVCTPCSCMTHGMASCYEYMAEQERAKEQAYRDAIDLLKRAKKYGICGGDK